ncbi:unnamed protein product, partial [Polarella glacialis]
QMLCELQNPWALGQWKGRWGPASYEMISRGGLVPDPDPESCKPFWMSIQDFCQHFTEVVEARMVPSSWQCAAVTHSSDRPSFPLVSVASSSQAIFVLTQSDARLSPGEELAPIGLRVYQCRIVAPPQNATGVKQNVSSPFKNLELLAEKLPTKVRSVMVEIAKLEPNCLYVAAAISEPGRPLALATLRVLTASALRGFRELSAPESSYFLKAEQTATPAIDTDSFSSQGSLENGFAPSTPVRN